MKSEVVNPIPDEKQEYHEDGWPKNKDGEPDIPHANHLMLIQSELKVNKTHKNKFGGYMYRNCDDIMEAVKPLLLKYRCGMYMTDDVQVIGNYIYVIATVNFQDSLGNKTQSKAFAREPDSKSGMSSEQVTGSASSYARKYALAGLFLLDDGKDADSDDDSKEPEKQEAKPQDPVKKIEDINKFMEIWTGGKLYSGKFVFWNSRKFEASPEQINIIKKHPKYTE